MKFMQIGEFKENVMEIPREIQPIEWAQREPLKRLNFLLKLVEKYYPKKYDSYVKNLSEKYNSMITEDWMKKSNLTLKKIISNLSLLQKHQELAKAILNYFLKLLNIKDEIDWFNDKYTIPNRNYLLSFLHPRYYNLLVLIETLGRENAIKLYKRFITEFFIEEQKDLENRVESVEEIYQRSIKMVNNPSEWVIVFGVIGDGKYAYKNLCCSWIDVLEDLPDKEIKYLICCYGDYERVKVSNKQFILTMEHTIAQGDPYCSRVIHDTRVDYSLIHPPKEFWDNMKVND
ncbi:MAG: hypothetical protein FK734_15440 [Asgard group archaeon]|nr:hypothetical protein [Asgard group archaeon]